MNRFERVHESAFGYLFIYLLLLLLLMLLFLQASASDVHKAHGFCWAGTAVRGSDRARHLKSLKL